MRDGSHEVVVEVYEGWRSHEVVPGGVGGMAES